MVLRQLVANDLACADVYNLLHEKPLGKEGKREKSNKNLHNHEQASAAIFILPFAELIPSISHSVTPRGRRLNMACPKHSTPTGSQTAAAGGRPRSARCGRAHLWRPRASLLARPTQLTDFQQEAALSTPPPGPNLQLATPVSRC